MKTAYWIAGATALTVALTGAAALAAADGPGGKRQGHGPRINFETLDSNGDGQITRDEMVARAQTRFNEADSDGDGKLTQAELEASIRARAEDRAAKMSARMLERRDTDGDGALTLQEMAPANGDRFFDRFDTDDDGAISAEEFAEARKMRKRHFGGGERRGGGD